MTMENEFDFYYWLSIVGPSVLASTVVAALITIVGGFMTASRLNKQKSSLKALDLVVEKRIFAYEQLLNEIPNFNRILIDRGSTEPWLNDFDSIQNLKERVKWYPTFFSQYFAWYSNEVNQHLQRYNYLIVHSISDVENGKTQVRELGKLLVLTMSDMVVDLQNQAIKDLENITKLDNLKFKLDHGPDYVPANKLARELLNSLYESQYYSRKPSGLG